MSNFSTDSSFSSDENSGDTFEMTPNDKRLATALLCYHDFKIGNNLEYVHDSSIFIDAMPFLEKCDDGKQFLEIAVKCCSFLTFDMCELLKPFVSEETLRLKNLEYLRENELNEEELESVRKTLSNHLTFEIDAPIGDNLDLYKKIHLPAMQLVDLAIRSRKPEIMDLFEGPLPTSAPLLPLNYMEYIVENWAVEKYISYLTTVVSHGNILPAEIAAKIPKPKDCSELTSKNWDVNPILGLMTIGLSPK